MGEARMDRIQALWERVGSAGRRWFSRAWSTARDPLRVLPVLAVAALLLIAIPLIVTGLSRVARAGIDWRSEATVRWQRAEATVTGVRDADGMLVQLRYRDARGREQRAETYVADPTKKWIRTRVSIRFDPQNLDRVELVGFGDRAPIPALLLAGAPLGGGVGALVIAMSLWRRRRLVAVSASPFAVMRRPVIVGVTILLAGLGAWATGTVAVRGWSAVASSTGHLMSTIFGDLLGVLLPLVAFALGCLLTAWLARHRNHADHDGLLSSAHRLIDRAAGLVPSPEELRAGEGTAEETSEGTSVPITR